MGLGIGYCRADCGVGVAESLGRRRLAVRPSVSPDSGGGGGLLYSKTGRGFLTVDFVRVLRMYEL